MSLISLTLQSEIGGILAELISPGSHVFIHDVNNFIRTWCSLCPSFGSLTTSDRTRDATDSKAGTLVSSFAFLLVENSQSVTRET